MSDRRTHTQLEGHVAKALHRETVVFGVKGPSPLYNVKGFDLIEGFLQIVFMLFFLVYLDS